MIEEILIGYLTPLLNVPVLTDVPEERPEEWVLIQRASQYTEDFVEHGTVILWSYAPTTYRAALLDRNVRKHLALLAERVDSVSKATIENSFNDTDTQTKEHRYRSEVGVVFFEEK